MRPVARLAQIKNRSAGNNLAPVRQECFQYLPEVQQFGLALVQRDHVYAEDTLQWRLLVEVVEHNVGHFPAPQFNHDAHAVFVRLVAQFGNALDALFAHEIRDFFNQTSFIHLIRQLGDNNRFLTAFIDDLDIGPRPNVHTATTRSVGRIDTRRAIDNAGGREIRPRNDFHQFTQFNGGIVDHRQAGVDDLGQVVRRYVGCHTDRDTRGTIDQQVRDPGWHDRRFGLGTVVILYEINGLFLDIGENFMGNLGHSHFGVAHGRRRVSVDRTKVTLTVNQHIAH